MEKINELIHQLPDAVNCSQSKDFTQVPNSLLRNPEISGKAKALLCLLLSNKEGWTSYQTTISKMMKEGTRSINSAIQELEQNGYLVRYRYRDKKTKSWKGSFWAYTDLPYKFNVQKNIDLLDLQGLEIYFKDKENPHVQNPHVQNADVQNAHVGNADVQNARLIILKEEKNTNTNNKTKTKKRKRLNNIVAPLKKDATDSDYTQPSNKTETIGSKNKTYLPIAQKLANLITSKKRVKISGQKLNGWANSIRLMVTADGIKPTRITDALDWYSDHYTDDYVPVIESGSSLREKFLRLEAAIERSKNSGKTHKGSGFTGKQTLQYQKSKKV